MSITAIEAALERHLLTLTDPPPIAWEDVSYKPTTDRAYLRVHHLHNSPRDKYIAGGDAELLGIFQIDVVHPAGQGKVAAKLLAERIAGLFAPVQTLDAGPYSLGLLDTPAIASGYPDDAGWYCVPVSIRWRAFPT